MTRRGVVLTCVCGGSGEPSDQDTSQGVTEWTSEREEEEEEPDREPGSTSPSTGIRGRGVSAAGADRSDQPDRLPPVGPLRRRRRGG